MNAWPAIQFEQLAWNRSTEDLSLIPKSKRRKITAKYNASIPAAISKLPVPEMPIEISQRINELTVEIVRFDAEQAARGYDLPALMLRSESASSSQIERLTSSIKNVALAELSDMVPANAKTISRNVAAMRNAIATGSTALTPKAISDMHAILMGDCADASDEDLPQLFRSEQVWIGGTPYSPHGAIFVPPSHTRVSGLIEDWICFCVRQNINPLLKLAIAHAQFETIHPFTDGNGRTGRALLHTLLAHDGILQHATLPISAGLLHQTDKYMNALSLYQQGDIMPIVGEMLDALEIAVVAGRKIAALTDAAIAEMNGKIGERKGSAMYKLPQLLVEQPVVNIEYVARGLGITHRAAQTLVNKACEYAILNKMGNAKRGAFYQCSVLIDILEDASSAEGIRRFLLK